MHFFKMQKTLHESVSCHNTVHLNTLGQNIVLGYCRDNPYVQQNTTKPTTLNRCVGGKRVVRESFISLFRTLQHRRQFYPEAPQSEIPNGKKKAAIKEKEKKCFHFSHYFCGERKGDWEKLLMVCEMGGGGGKTHKLL